MSFQKGTVIKVSIATTVLSGSNPDSANITIYSPSDSALISEASMTDDGSGAYSYVYQTPETSGEYTVITKALSGEYTGVSKSTFVLNDR